MIYFVVKFVFCRLPSQQASYMDDENIYDINIDVDDEEPGESRIGLGQIFHILFAAQYDPDFANDPGYYFEEEPYDESDCSCPVKDHVQKRDSVKREELNNEHMYSFRELLVYSKMILEVIDDIETGEGREEAKKEKYCKAHHYDYYGLRKRLFFKSFAGHECFLEKVQDTFFSKLLTRLKNDVLNILKVRKKLLTDALKNYFPQLPDVALFEIVGYLIDADDVMCVQDNDEEVRKLTKSLQFLCEYLLIIATVSYDQIDIFLYQHKKAYHTQLKKEEIIEVKNAIERFPQMWKDVQDLIEKCLSI